jgi:N-acetylglucosamine malate deacetylase 1
LVTVPNVVPLAPYLPKNPTIAYVSDGFQRPCPFKPDVVVAIDEVIEQKLEALHCHESQMYEWLAFNQGVLDEVPASEDERRRWLARTRLPGFAAIADRYRDHLIRLYGPERGSRVRYAEAFEGCEYGSSITPEIVPKLFPFFGSAAGQA